MTGSTPAHTSARRGTSSQALAASAQRLGCSERTLRRYVKDGALRAHQAARRRLDLSDSEAKYLVGHWELLHGLRAALRTERAVRLAVLFGSTAVGDDNDFSDIDLLVIHRHEAPRALAGLKMRLRRTLERRVDVVGLGQAESTPTLLADILREGRVLVDRDGLWEGLQGRRHEIFAAAAREERETAINARRTVAAARTRIVAQRRDARLGS